MPTMESPALPARPQAPFAPLHRAAPAGTVGEEIAAWALKDPDRAALEWEGRQVSYATLLQEAAGLARRLSQQGVAPGCLVGLLAERSPQTIVAMLAIHRAGGAYLPLDPAYPPQRLADLIADSGIQLLLCQDASAIQGPALPAASPLRLPLQREIELALQAGTRPVSSCHKANDPLPAGARDLAYVIYTSGSTGQPKGVAIEQHSLANLVWALRREYALRPADRVLQFTSLSFDISVEEIFSTLASGATLVLRPERMLDSFPDFVALCVQLRLTVLNIPTAFWHGLTAALTPDLADRLASTVRLLVIGGEAANAERLRLWKQRLGTRIRLLNAYGPTEATVTATLWDAADYLAAPGQEPLPEIPIGRPLANLSAHLLDEDLRPVPPGQPGELFLGGAGIARGYWNRPELTRTRFLATAQGRLYRTGDLARELPSGELVCLGRTDDQLKIRGFRIEPGEIEAALLRHPDVAEAVVTARGTAPQAKQLAGYVVFKQATAPDLAALRVFLAGVLPSHLIPSFLVALPALPLTPNGKLDRQALPDPPRQGQAQGAESGEWSEVEREVGEAFARVLGLERVSLEEDFLALGGDSLKAIDLVLELEQRLAKRLPARQVLDNPTVRGVAASLAATREEARTQALDPVAWAVKAPYLRRELSWFVLVQWSRKLFGMAPGALNVAAMLQLKGRLDVAALETALNLIVRRHETLRMIVPPACGVQTWGFLAPFFRWSIGRLSLNRKLTSRMLEGMAQDDARPYIPLRTRAPLIRPELELRLEREDPARGQATADPAALRGLLEELVRRPFDCERGPLLRARLYRSGPEEHVLAVVFHHLVADGGSVPVFTRELVALYRSLVRGERPELPPLPVQYSDHVYGLSRGDRSAERFWREHFDRLDADTSLPLPFWRSCPPAPDYQLQAATVAVTVPQATREALLRYGAARHCTPYTVYLAALAALCHCYARRERIPLEVALAGRETPEAAGLIACLATCATLITDCSGDPDFEDLLGRIRRQVLELLSHQQVSNGSMFGFKMASSARAENHRVSGDLPRVFFNFRPFHAIPQEMPGLEVREVQLPDPAWGDIEVSAVDQQSHLELWFQYSKDRYHPQGVETMARDYLLLLQALGSGEAGRLSELGQRFAGPYRPGDERS